MTTTKMIIISGPTASGKTSLSLELCEYIQTKLFLSAEIVNFDSLLFYKEISMYLSQHLSEFSYIKTPFADYKQTKTLPVRQGLPPQGSTNVDCIQYFIFPAVRPDWKALSD